MKAHEVERARSSCALIFRSLTHAGERSLYARRITEAIHLEIDDLQISPSPTVGMNSRFLPFRIDLTLAK